MIVCLFVASGLSFDVDAYLKKSPFKAVQVFRKRDIPPKDNPKNKPRPDSGFVVIASQGSGMLSDALKFLIKNEEELDRLKAYDVDNMLLDFGMEAGNELEKSEYLPPELIALLARFHMGLVFSVVQIPRG